VTNDPAATDEVALPPNEEAQYAACAKILSVRRTPFYELGTALETLQALRLFRGRFETFERCAARFGYKKTHAYALIAAARIMRALSAIADKGPTPRTESQVRPLTLLSTDQAVQAWREAWDRATTAGRSITAGIVRRVVEERWPELAAPPKTPGREKLAMRRGFNSASTALKLFHAATNCDPAALKLLEEAVSILGEALNDNPGTL
jgi:hypothetical protein